MFGNSQELTHKFCDGIQSFCPERSELSEIAELNEFKKHNSTFD